MSAEILHPNLGPPPPAKPQPKPKPKKRIPLISKAEYQEGVKRTKALITELGLKVSETHRTTIVGQNQDSHQIATVRAKAQTVDRYAKALKDFLEFCFFMEDYESAIILMRDHCPENPPPVSDDTAILFLRYKVQLLDETVLHHKSHVPVVSRGKPLKAVGSWTAVSTIGIFRSALSQIHKAYDTTRGSSRHKNGSYFLACKECRKLTLEQRQNNKSCGAHNGHCQAFGEGNVIESETFGQHFSMIEKYAQQHYMSKSSASFLPSQLRTIRDHCANDGSLAKLMQWCVIILGCRLYLRIDEVLSLETESFVPKYFVIKGKTVISLCVKIKGKCDGQERHFQVYDDPKYPELSPVRPLLLYIAATKRTGGFLFPKSTQMFDANPTAKYYYGSFLTHIEFFVKLVGMDLQSGMDGEHLIAGTHMLRKTAFLLAYWAIKLEQLQSDKESIPTSIPSHEESAIFNDAAMKISGQSTNVTLLADGRHGSLSVQMTYLGDAATLFGLFRQLNRLSTNEMVGPYFPIFIKQLGNLLHIANNGSGTCGFNKKSLPELASWFVFDLMQVDSETDLARNIPELCRKAKALNHVEKEVSTEILLNKLKKHLPPELFTQAMTRMTSLPTKSGDTTMTDSDVTTNTIPPATLQSSLPNYQELCRKAKTNEAKLSIVIQAFTRMTKPPPKKTHLKANRWYYHQIRTYRCVQGCFNGNTCEFLQKCKEKGIQNVTGRIFKCPNKCVHTK
ncbi:unnamed protein product [Cylindrotheca closterium]|uniref:Uncharacterized protein n=1 Tax=Cylindrotheca closterium TaxID=2856 RepID=A0AAD2CP14_9STRA|nr:unnamed protein product [Cylindrotheca closterium]CAJ1949526.1 unnamed protein product [Cylindrotheca closterium]